MMKKIAIKIMKQCQFAVESAKKNGIAFPSDLTPDDALPPGVRPVYWCCWEHEHQEDLKKTCIPVSQYLPFNSNCQRRVRKLRNQISPYAICHNCVPYGITLPGDDSETEQVEIWGSPDTHYEV
jgi:hypothetical protein